MVWRCVQDFVDGAFKEVQSANRGMGGEILGTEFTPCRGENERGVDDPKRYATVIEKSGEAPVTSSRAQWRAGQAHVVADDGGYVGRPAGVHAFFLRRAALPSGSHARGSFRPR